MRVQTTYGTACITDGCNEQGFIPAFLYPYWQVGINTPISVGNGKRMLDSFTSNKSPVYEKTILRMYLHGFIGSL